MKILSIFSLIVLIQLGGCVSNVDENGYTFEQVEDVKIEPGKSSKSEVQKLLGTPSSTSDFGKETWFYISAEVKNSSFYMPKIKQQKILAITFNNQGIVEEVTDYTEKNLKNVEVVTEKTEAAGHDESFITDFFGNIGKFNGAESRMGTDPARRRQRY